MRADVMQAEIMQIEMLTFDDVRVSTSSVIHHTAKIGKRCVIWHWVQIREDVVIGDNVIIGKGVYIDKGVHIGSNVKIQNNVSIYRGVTIGDGVFLGPHVCFTNDLYPKAVDDDGELLKDGDWPVQNTYVLDRARIGANSTILCGIRLGYNCMIGAGSTVVKNVPDYCTVVGSKAVVIKRSQL